MTEREAFLVVKRWFQDDDWKFDSDDEHNLIRTGINGESGKFRVYAHVQNDNLIVHSVSPTDVAEKDRAAVAEFLTRANYGLVIGNFEMDWSDGEVRFKTSLRWKNGTMEPWMVGNLVYINCAMMDRYYPGLMSVLFGGATPEQAVRKVEQ